MLEQEQRRQAMLQHMGLEVWLPRCQLPAAAVSRDFLLAWDTSAHPADDEQAEPAIPVAQPVASEPATVTQPVRPAQVRNSLEKIRHSLNEQPSKSALVDAVSEAKDEAPVAEAIEEVTLVEIPRFALQMLRSGSCLLLLDLPVGESLQARDPEYILLKDMLRAAQLSPEPSMLRNAEPIRWPILSGGNLATHQDEQAARSYVRELLHVESTHQPTRYIWLLGQQAARFACEPKVGLDLFELLPFAQQTQCWVLPSLETLMQDPSLKRQLWHSMQQHMAGWAAHD